MPKLTFRNSHGQLVDISTVAATKVKNEFGAILEQAMHSGAVAITRHDMPRAVLLSFAEFESLVKERSRSLDDLSEEFDGLLADMQTPQARKGVEAAFNASPAELGRGAFLPPRGHKYRPVATYSCVGRRQWCGEEQRRRRGRPSLRRRVFQSGRSGLRPQREASALIQADADSAAWRQGASLLSRAIDEPLEFTFELTLGGNTITSLLVQAAEQGTEVHVWYEGLASPELHIAHVQARVSRGGHDIHRRYEHSRFTLSLLLPHLPTLHVYDNSKEADPAASQTPKSTPLLHMARGEILGSPDLAATPTWAKPIVAAAIKLNRS